MAVLSYLLIVQAAVLSPRPTPEPAPALAASSAAATTPAPGGASSHVQTHAASFAKSTATTLSEMMQREREQHACALTTLEAKLNESQQKVAALEKELDDAHRRSEIQQVHLLRTQQPIKRERVDDAVTEGFEPVTRKAKK